MNIFKFLKYIFSIDTKSSNRIIIYILGIKIRFLKPWIKDSAKEYLKYDCPISEIPKATGTLRKIQLANLKITLIFKELCEQNGLKYWLDYGNALGAYRHKGYIPWDDDIDLGMMRDDYEKFIELYKDGIPNHNELYLDFCNNGRNKCFLKIRHKNLVNIAIDIFPYDYYYEKTTKEEKYEITKNIDKYMHFNSVIYRLLQPIYINSSTLMRKRIFKIRDNVILKGNIPKPEDKPSIVYGMDYPHLVNPLLYDYETIFPLGMIEYEGFTMSCPNNIHEFLTQIYGDYMTLPDDCYPRHANSEGFQDELAQMLDNFISDLSDKL